MDDIKYGVIPAAGMGRRISSISEEIPKPLIPLDDNPIIYHVIQNMLNCGVESIIVPVWYKGEMIEKYLNTLSRELDTSITVIRLKELPPGIACTIYSTKKFVKDDFMVILGDDVTVSPSLFNLVRKFHEKDAIVVEGVVEEHSISNLMQTCAVILDEDKKIVEIEEKPLKPSSLLRGCGLYVFSEQIFDLIEKTPVSQVRNEREITDTIGIAKDMGRAFGEVIDGYNFNINTVNDLNAARQYLDNMKKWYADGRKA